PWTLLADIAPFGVKGPRPGTPGREEIARLAGPAQESLAGVAIFGVEQSGVPAQRQVIVGPGRLGLEPAAARAAVVERLKGREIELDEIVEVGREAAERPAPSAAPAV